MYRSIAVNAAKWNKLVYNLPKYGIHTREIYLEAITRQLAVFENLRAIGDFCPNLVRLDLAFPIRVSLAATEADLPPKIGIETTAPVEEKAPSVMPVDEDVEMPDAEEMAPDGATAGDTNVQMDEQTDAQIIPVAAQEGVDGGVNAQVVPAIAQDGADGDDGGDGGNDANGGDGGGDDSDDDGDNHNADDDPIFVQANDAVATEYQAQKTLTAQMDFIIKNCPMLQNFSMQWTGHQALERFHQKIPNLKGIRLWDRVNDKHLIEIAKACRDLERIYIEDIYHGVTLAGLIGLLTGLRTKGKSKLRRFGLKQPVGLVSPEIPNMNMDMDDDDDDDDFDGDGDGDGGGDDDGDGGDGDGDGADGDGDGDGDGLAMPAFFAPLPPPQPVVVDPPQSPILKFLDVLSEKHPFLERLCLSQCQITDNIVSKFGSLPRLKSLDISYPFRCSGLSAVGITELVSVFRGKSLSALDLSGHVEMTDDDIQILTGADGIESLRYIKFKRCPKLTPNYIMEEWVHSDDLVIEDGTWAAADKNLLEIGEGWKEQWGD